MPPLEKLKHKLLMPDTDRDERMDSQVNTKCLVQETSVHTETTNFNHASNWSTVVY